MTLSLERADLLCSQSLLAGRWIGAADGGVFAVTDPATGELIGQVPDCAPEDAAAAVDAAQHAFEAFRHVPARERAALLKRWHALILGHRKTWPG